jgi:hypothetical protein
MKISYERIPGPRGTFDVITEVTTSQGDYHKTELDRVDKETADKYLNKVYWFAKKLE